MRFWNLLWVACFCCAQSLYAQVPALPPPPLLPSPCNRQLIMPWHIIPLLSAQQNLFSMKGQEVKAGLRQNPNFTVYGSDLSNPATSTTPYAYSLQLSRLFERGQKRGGGAWIARGQ